LRRREAGQGVNDGIKKGSRDGSLFCERAAILGSAELQTRNLHAALACV
jgi:hypothetical protein